MDSVGVLMTYPMNSYLEQRLEQNFKLFKLWNIADKRQFLDDHKDSIRVVACNTVVGPDADLIDLLPKLEIVSTCSVGMDKIDLAKCKEKGILVTNTPDVLTEDVADVAIGLMLAVVTRFCEYDRFVRNGEWRNEDCKQLLASKLSGKSVGILGLGRIGMAVAKRAEAFGCSISYHSRTEKQNTKYKYFPSLVELASNYQILVISCSLNQETHHIINREVIDSLGPKGILINIGRGAHVDELELESALLQGRHGGAGLDVFEQEPQVPGELFALGNVVLSPHAASGTEETRTAMADLVFDNLEAHFLNKPLLNPVL